MNAIFKNINTKAFNDSYLERRCCVLLKDITNLVQKILQ